VAQGLHSSYNDCLKEEVTSYKMQRPLHNQPSRTYSKDSSEDTYEEGLNETLRMSLEDQLRFRRGKGTRHATGIVRIISERTLEIDAEVCVCFIQWQKAFDQVK
jgi:hypothetical protein